MEGHIIKSAEIWSKQKGYSVSEKNIVGNMEGKYE